MCKSSSISVASISFVLRHLACLTAIWLACSWKLVALCAGIYVVGMFAGTRRFETGDQSRNNFGLAIITLGEGGHNNHHHYQDRCRQGILWWECDPAHHALKLLSWVRIVRDIRPFPVSTRL